ncbi:hypothetical protein J3U05_00020, partial [Gilliamella sp. B2737]
ACMSISPWLAKTFIPDLWANNPIASPDASVMFFNAVMSVWFSAVTLTLLPVDNWIFSGLVNAMPACA